MRMLRSILAALAVVVLLASSASAARAGIGIRGCIVIESGVNTIGVQCNDCGAGTTPDRITEEHWQILDCDGRIVRTSDTYRYCDLHPSCDHAK